MLHSLRYRFMIVIVIVAVIAVGAVGLLSSRVTSVAFDRYVMQDAETNLDRFRPLLLEHYEKHGGWNDVQQVLDQIGNLTGRQLILLDAQGKMLAAAPIDLRQAEVRITPDNKLFWRQRRNLDGKTEVSRFDLINPLHIALHDTGGTTIGTLYLAPIPLQPPARNGGGFIGSVNRSLWLAALASLMVAAFAAIFLARRIVGPVEALTFAVRRMAGGDLSQRVKVDSKDEVGSLASAFNFMADSLTRAEQLRRNMVNDIAHELRTPLTNIRCQLETLQDGMAHPTPEMIDSLHEEAMLLNSLIDDLQDLALAEAGQLRLEPRPISAADEVNLAVASLRQQAHESGLTIEVEIPERLPPVHADPRRVGQVLRNLLRNAITHTPAGGNVRISALDAGTSIEFMIQDTGHGIDPEHLPYIFERFYRADSSRDRATGGAGLGLAIVKQLMLAHGSQIRAESIKGQGTTIHFTLPVVKV
jgi:signal transduction histidine kinase